MVTFLFLMLCPFIFEQKLVEPSNVPRFLSLTLLLGFVFIVWIFQKRSLYIPPVYLLLLLLGFYFVNSFSISFALNSADAFYESQRMFLVPCILLLLLNWLINADEEILLIKSLTIIALLYSIYAIIELAQLPNFRFETLYDVHSFAEHKNLLASFLFLLSAFPIFGLINFKSYWKVISGLAFLLLLLLIILLQVRSVYLALLFTGLLLFLCNRKRLKIENRKIWITAFVLVLFFVVMVILIPDLLERFNVFAYSSSESGNERLKIWSKTFSLIREHPIFGVGAGNWQYNYLFYGIGEIENVSRHNISFQRPHNDLLWIMAETGIVGFMLILLVIIYIFKKSFSEIKAGNFNVILYFSFLSGLLVESCFSFPKERILHIFLTSIILALLIKNLGLAQSVKSKTGKTLLILLVMILIFSTLIAYYRIKGEYYTVLLLDEKAKNNPVKVIKNAQKTISVFYLSDPTSTPIYTYLGWGYATLGKIDSLLYVSTQAYKISPFDPEVLSNYGYALEKTENRKQARKKLKEALRINPYYEEAIINLVVVEYNSKQYEQALSYLSSIEDYKNKYKFFYDKIAEKLSAK